VTSQPNGQLQGKHELKRKEEKKQTNQVHTKQNKRLKQGYLYYLDNNNKKVKVKLSRYTPWRHMGGEEV
jgi:hypothetical protein